MLLDEYLSLLSGPTSLAEFGDWNELINELNTIENFAKWNGFVLQHEAVGDFVAKERSWEFFDHICACFLVDYVSDSFIMEVQTCIRHTTSRMSPKELYMIAMEKLLGCTSLVQWPILLFMLQLAVLHMNTVEVHNSGCVLALKSGIRLCSMTNKKDRSSNIGGKGWDDPDSDHDENFSDDAVEEEEANFDATAKSNATTNSVIEALLVFCKGVACRSDAWLQGDNDGVDSTLLAQQQNNNQICGILTGLLLNIASQLVTQLSTASDRSRCMNTITELILPLHARLDDLLLQIERDRYRMFRATKHGAIEEIVSGSNSVAGGNTSSVRAVSPSRYLRDAELQGLTQLHGRWSSSSNNSAACIPYDHVSDVNINKLPHKLKGSLHLKRKIDGDYSSNISHSRTDKYTPIEYYTLSSPRVTSAAATTDASREEADNDEVCISSSLLWSITGIAMVVHCIAHSMFSSDALSANGGGAAHFTPPLSSSSGAKGLNSPSNVTTSLSNLPLVYSEAYIKSSAVKYAHALIRHSTLATCEGLEFVNLLYGASASAISPLGPKLFSPVDCPLQAEGEGVRRLMECYYSSSIQSKDDERRSVILSADSTDTISLLQSMITALASCSDNQLRNSTFLSLRAVLKRYEERSLLSLLLKLIEQCPFISITGLLIDILKECSQAASLGKVWSSYQLYVPTFTTSARIEEAVSLSLLPITLKEALTAQSSEAVKTCRENGDWASFQTSASINDVKLGGYNPPSSATASDTSGSSMAKSMRYKEDSDQREKEEKMIEQLVFTWGLREPSSSSAMAAAAVKGSSTECKSTPLWSPLITHALILPRLREYVHYKTSDQLLDNVDVVGAVVNFIQFLTLRLSVSVEVKDGQPVWSTNDESSTRTFKQYFSTSPQSIEHGFTAVRALQELIEMSKLMLKLNGLVKDSLLPEFTAKSKQKLDILRLQLLTSNIGYVAERLNKLCLLLLWLMASPAAVPHA